ncbi:MAG: sialidase family protein, partial [Kiritimatiellales bacterium]
MLTVRADDWSYYAVYQPTIERVFVCDATAQNLRYNHDSSIVWFLDRWFCVWNANTVPKEGAPGQLNYVSTSSDGQTWSTPQPVFSDPGLSSNPIPCPTGTQWQPNLIVVSNRLWCFWLQWSSSDNYEGCYFSMLDSPDGKWKNQKLTWGGNIHPMIDGKAFDPFPTQNPVRLRTGRVLVPVTLMGPISAEAAAAGLTAREKRNSVIYTDDNGTTWQVSPGTVLPGLDWRQWEPTVFEQPDGSVMMFARNDLSPSKENGTVKPAETLTWSISKDGGATWSPQAFVPLQTVVSRMHVLQQENSDRYLMIHNDWLAGSKDERHNLALFFNRGGGMDFVAGTGLTDTDIRACYAQMAFHGQSLLASYSEQGSSNLKVVRVTPLPDPNQLYIYPRANIPASPRFAVTNDAISLAGGLALKCRTVPNVSPAGLSCAAWIKPINFVNVALFDNRSSAGGFVWGYSSWLNVYLVDPAISITSHLPIKFGRTNYFGLTLDYVNGYATFYVNGEHETVTFTPGTRSMASASATVAGPNGVSNLSQFEGDLYAFAFYGTNRLSDTEHGSLFQTQSVALPQTPPSLLLAPADAPALARDFVLPTNNLPIAPESVQTVQSDGKTLIRFTGATSAGVELGANERAYGDIADLEFAFRLESGDGQTLCTVGDANQPARVLVSGTNILLCANNQTIPCGRATPGVWQRLALKTGKTVTRVTLDSNPPAEIQHTPEATWIYLGDGYRPDSPTNYAVFSIDVQSVRSRVFPAEVFLHESFITGTTSANGEYGIGILRDVSPSAAGGTIVGFSAGSPWSVNTALPLVSASGLSSAGVTGAGGAVVFRGNSETAYSTRGAMRAI